MKPVGPFWRFYGGKWAAALRYAEPQHNIIIEPFAGAAGYSCRYWNRQVILIDADPIIAGIWRYMVRATPSEILRLPDIPEGGTCDDLVACQEARWLAGFWLNQATVQPQKSPSKWAQRGPNDRHWGGWNYRSRRQIARGVEKIKHWTVIEGDYTSAPDLVATWFIDPPYQMPAGRYYKRQPGCFAALGGWALARQGQVIACDQEGADWLPWTGRINITGAHSRRLEQTSKEVVYHRPSELAERGQVGLPW